MDAPSIPGRGLRMKNPERTQGLQGALCSALLAPHGLLAMLPHRLRQLRVPDQMGHCILKIPPVPNQHTRPCLPQQGSLLLEV